VVRRVRLDVELVRRGLARSRAHAAELIAAGRVRVAGHAAVKPATAIDTASGIDVAPVVDAGEYVSRGGHKLAGALDVFEAQGFAVQGRRCLDAGASTGGFTEVLLRRGATSVVAVDVGYGQLAWSLRTDPRVVVLERTNIRDFTVDAIGGPVSVVVADLSFISLQLVLPAMSRCVTPDADLALLVKPQFEVGRDMVPRGGVVRDSQLRTSAVLDVAEFAYKEGLGFLGCVASPLPGPSGNVEYFIWLRPGGPAPQRELMERAVREGPQ
jgi:23S rRNA (cytidine1920-2'-O)/16S rRNA (cytidine1409-2'-O)-methyltransferase